MSADAGFITLARPRSSRAATSAIPLKIGERLTLRVLKSTPGGLSLKLKGRVFTTKAHADLTPGRSFPVKVTAVSPQIILRRVPENDAASIRIQRALSPKIASFPRMMDSLAALFRELELLPPTESKLGEELAALRAGLARLLSPAGITPQGLARLFELLGASARPPMMAELREFFGKESIRRRIGGLMKLPPAAWEELVRAGRSMESVENIVRGLASLKQSIEIIRAANIVLSRREGLLFVEWPPFTPDSGPLKVLVRGALGKKWGRGKKKEISVEMRLDLTALGEVRAHLVYGPAISLTIHAGKECCRHLEDYREAFAGALSRSGKPARVHIRPLPEDPEPFPDLLDLLGKGEEGEGGRSGLHLWA